MMFWFFFILFADSGVAQTKQSVEGYFQRAQELEKQRDLDGAERTYGEALQGYPDNPDLLKALGGLYQQERKFQKAVEAFERVLKRAPLYPGVNFLMGVSCYAMNQYNKAIDAYNQELKGNP